ncbi:hypothetical protein BGX27_011010 [Mortierella sp. AM989]|nr:hypothetical protein BGX27_011010 [Mortierella sp. AM989]
MLTLEAVKALFGACSKIVQVAEGEEEDNVVTPKNSADGLRTLRLDDLSFRECTADILSDFAPLIHLQHIHIQGIHGLESEGQLRLLMLCPNIKSFYWRGILFKTKFQVDRWVEYIESGMWPQLTSLDVLGEEFHDEGLSRVIERLPLPLTKMLVKTTDFGPMAFHSLISISRHYTHLQELELFACSNVTSSMIQQVMVTMPALEHFSANRLCVTDIFGISSKHQSGISGYGGSWICKNLRILKLCIDMGVDSDPQALEYVEQQRQVHQRLSKLERLEVLEVSRDLPYREGIVKVRKLDHRLSTGLGHLSSLKRLRKFQFKPGQTLTMEEIEWMASTWEFLTTVSRNMNLDQKVNDELVKRLAKHNISVL